MKMKMKIIYVAFAALALSFIGFESLQSPQKDPGCSGCKVAALELHQRPLAATESLAAEVKAVEPYRNLAAKASSAGGDVRLDRAIAEEAEGYEVVTVPVDFHDKRACWIQVAVNTSKGKSLGWTLTFAGQGLVMFRDLKGAGMDLRFDRNGALKSTDEVFAQSENGLRLASSPGYWSCVRNCLQSSWGYLPWWLKWACSGACASCLWTPNIYGCAGCAGCMGGYAIFCLTHC